MNDERRAERNWLDFIADILSIPSTTMPAQEIAIQLLETLNSAGCAYTSVHRSSRWPMWPPDFWGGPAHYDNAEIAARESNHHHPIVQYYWAIGRTPATQIADVPERFHADWRSRGLDSYYREVGASHHLSLPIGTVRTSHVAFVVGRDARYTESEMRLARTVQQLLVGLAVQTAALRSSSGAAGNDNTDSASTVGLTPREVAVLALVAKGLTATAIGRRLLIAPGTVHKHLQNAYAKLEVCDRLSAVLRAERLGVLVGRNARS